MSDSNHEADKKPKKETLKKPSQKQAFDVPIRAINANTNPRNPLSASLQSQGWDCMQGEKQVWPLAVSDDASERAMFVQLMQDFDPEIVSLAATILAQGLLEPVEVCEGGSGKFRLVFGCRRCLAILYNWCLLGKPKEPYVLAFTVKGNTTALLHRALVENIRKPQSVIDEARVIQMAVNNGEELAEVARQLGMSASTAKGRLDLLTLDPKEQRKLHEGKITVKAIKDESREAKARENGETVEKKPKIRGRKEIEAAMAEFAESSKEYAVLEWVLGNKEKIK